MMEEKTHVQPTHMLHMYIVKCTENGLMARIEQGQRCQYYFDLTAALEIIPSYTYSFSL